ncbi:DUF6455 family protein [Pseudorhodobacter wandonensis]|jgi:hypothetical protein|uniref:DUF6455 family protein n=1 Tax=Pseudorhodobacter wandonensis TaxID=1120568 RepID=UPI00067CE413|nr:DUF6455 family protein [Pseudorhodobacter wandonensis]
MGFENSDLLLHKLTRKLGLPLDQFIRDGKLPDDIAANMARNCESCAAPARCESFVSEQPETIAAPPSFCVNCRLLTFLGKTLCSNS